MKKRSKQILTLFILGLVLILLAPYVPDFCFRVLLAAKEKLFDYRYWDIRFEQIIPSVRMGLSANLHSIASVSMRKNVFFVPLGQDDPEHKPYSLVADFSKLQATMLSALSGIQIQPVITILK